VLATLGKGVAGKIFLTLLVIGLFCYAFFALMFSIFDFDRLGHHGAFPVLARFGRLFSAGFYGFIGIAGVQVLSNIRRGNTSTALGNSLFSTPAGQGVLVFLGIVFLVVCIVYISYIIKPAKFRRELASERLPPFWFNVFVTIARIGAIGRVLFYGAFGVVLIEAVANNRGAQVNGRTSILGLEGVLQKIANASHALLFIVGAFLFVYALWAFVLALFRRIPAHYSEEEALAAVGMRYRVRKANKELPTEIETGKATELPSMRTTYPAAGADPLDAYITGPISSSSAIVHSPSLSGRSYAEQSGAVGKDFHETEYIGHVSPLTSITSSGQMVPPAVDQLRKSANVKRRTSLASSQGDPRE